MRSHVGRFVAGALMVVGLWLVASPALAEESVGRKVPSFETSNLDGERVSLDQLLGKGPVLFDFWATWCKPCIKELPYIQRLHDEYASRGLQVFAVSTDSPKSQSKVKPFIQGRRFTFPVLLDGTEDVFKKLQGQGSIPYVVVLDAAGRIRYQHTGYKPGDEKELESVVVELLGEAAPAGGAGETAAETPAG